MIPMTPAEILESLRVACLSESGRGWDILRAAGLHANCAEKAIQTMLIAREKGIRADREAQIEELRKAHEANLDAVRHLHADTLSEMQKRAAEELRRVREEAAGLRAKQETFAQAHGEGGLAALIRLTLRVYGGQPSSVGPEYDMEAPRQKCAGFDGDCWLPGGHDGACELLPF